MQRVLLYHPKFPHTLEHPISRLESKVGQYHSKGWELWPPPDDFPPPWWEEQTDDQPVSTLDEGEEE